FFFQAEDGIRDGHVTGVQTCALPICLNPFEDMLGFLSADKQRQIRQLEEKFAARQMGLFKDGFSGTDSLADMKRIMEEKQAEMRSEERRVGKECRDWWLS